MSVRRKSVLFSVAFFLLSLSIFLAVLIFSSPYRFLRPYTLKSGEKLIKTTDYRLSEYGTHWQIHISQTAHSFIPDFYIDQIPVTVTDYRQCVEEGACNEPHYHDAYEKHYAEVRYASYPVTFVTWQEASDYCSAHGGELPTVLQWEITAGLFEKNLYPWGNEEPNITRANYDGFYQGLTPSGWLPNGATRDGVLDMAGNIREWTAALHIPENDGKFDNDFRPANIIRAEILNPENIGRDRILKGGGAMDLPDTLKLKNYQYHAPGSAGFNRGFRCVYEIAANSAK